MKYKNRSELTIMVIDNETGEIYADSSEGYQIKKRVKQYEPLITSINEANNDIKLIESKIRRTKQMNSYKQIYIKGQYDSRELQEIVCKSNYGTEIFRLMRLVTSKSSMIARSKGNKNVCSLWKELHEALEINGSKKQAAFKKFCEENHIIRMYEDRLYFNPTYYRDQVYVGIKACGVFKDFTLNRMNDYAKLYLYVKCECVTAEDIKNSNYNLENDTPEKTLIA